MHESSDSTWDGATPRRARERFVQAARRSIQAVVGAAVLALLGMVILRPLHVRIDTHLVDLFVKVLAIVVLMLFVAGGVTGIVAVAGTSRYGNAGLLGRGLLGSLLSVVLALVLVPTLFQVNSRVRAQQDFRTALTNLMGTASGTPNELNDRLAATSAALGTAAEQASGTDAAVLNASAAFFSRVQKATEPYTTAMQRLQSAKVLDFGTIRARADIESRRGLVRAFVAANEGLRKFVESGPAVFAEETAKVVLTEDQRAKLVSRFELGFGRTQPLNLKIRAADAELAGAILGVLNLLDGQWGRWRFDMRTQSVRFSDRQAAQTYQAFTRQLQAAAAEQSKLQQQMVELKQTAQSQGAR